MCGFLLKFGRWEILGRIGYKPDEGVVSMRGVLSEHSGVVLGEETRYLWGVGHIWYRGVAQGEREGSASTPCRRRCSTNEGCAF